MEHHRVEHQEVRFLRAADLRKIVAALQVTRQHLLRLVALVCFAGLRPSEAVRLDWAEVGGDYIRLPGKKSKTGYSRQIPIQENLKAWLAQWRQEAGLVCFNINPKHVNVAIFRASGVRLTHDGMRHGYGTHRQMILKNVAQVANEMGNSVQVCRRHYLNAFCTEKEAVEWFTVIPSIPPNIAGLQQSGNVA
jgi:integrase